MPNARKPKKKPPASTSKSKKGRHTATPATGRRKAHEKEQQENTSPGTQRRSLNTSSNGGPVLEMRKIFNGFQVLSEIPKSIQSLVKMYQEKTPMFCESFSRCVLITLNLEDKSHYTRQIIESAAKFVSEIVKEEEKENQTLVDRSNCDDIGLETFGDTSFERSIVNPANLFVDHFLCDIVIPCLSSAKHNVRANACYLVGKLINEINDIDEVVFDQLKKVLVERLADKQTAVRVSAAKALTRFQETNKADDKVLSAYKFHMKNDLAHEVRLATLTSIEVTAATVGDVILRTRDVKEIVRRAAYLILSERVNAKSLSIANRIDLLRNGLNDRNKAVQKVVEKRLISAWLSHYENDVVELLVWLDIQSDPESAKKMLTIIFTKFLNEVEGNKNKLVSAVREFRTKFLDNRKLFTKSPLSVEKSFYWKVLTQFCKENEELIAEKTNYGRELDEEETLCKEVEEVLSAFDGNSTIADRTQEMSYASTMADGGSGSDGKPSGPSELVDEILPELPHLCTYIKRFARKIDSQNPSMEELLDFEFMYQQLMEMLLLHDVRDEAQNKVVVELADCLLSAKTLHEKFQKHIIPLMKFLSVGAMRNSSDLLHFTTKVTQNLYDSLVDSQTVDSQKYTKVNTTAEQRKLEVKCAALSVAISELRDQLEEAIKNGEYILADELKKKIEKLAQEKQEISDQINPVCMESDGGYSQTSQPTQQSQPFDLPSHPKIMLKMLQIVIGCLQFGDFEDINDTLQTLTDKIIIQGILTPQPNVKRFAVEALGLCCFIGKELAKKYFNLFVQILQHDVEAVQAIALKSIFDMVCQHGVQAFVEDKPKNQLNKTAERTISHNSNFQVPETPSDSGSHSGEKETAASEEAANVESDGDTLKSDESTEADTVRLLTELIDQQLKCSSEELRFVTAQGVAKLLILGRLYSPDLLSRLLLLFYILDDASEIRHFLGVFLPIYAYSKAECSNGLSAQTALEECYLDTVLKVYKAKASAAENSMSSVSSASDLFMSSQVFSVNIENMVSFVSQLMLPETHGRVAVSVCQKMMDILQIESKSQFESQEEFLTKYLPKCLSVLILEEASKEQLKEILVLMGKVNDGFSKRMLVIPILSKKRIEKFVGLAKTCLNQIRSEESMLNSSQFSERGAPAAAEQPMETNRVEKSFTETATPEVEKSEGDQHVEDGSPQADANDKGEEEEEQVMSEPLSEADMEETVICSDN